MRLRNRELPQAGTHKGESRPGPSGTGRPTYSGGGTTSLTTAQSSTVAGTSTNSSPKHYTSSSSSSSISSTHSLFPSPSSSPHSFQQSSTTTSPMSCDVAQKAPANYFVTTTDITNSTRILDDNSSSSVDHNTQPSLTDNNSLARSVLRDMLPSTTLAGKSRQRMKWTSEINIELLRCYYTVTMCETDMTAWRPLLHKTFIEQFPELSHVSEQRLSDQIRVIHRNNRIPINTRESIKHSIKQIPISAIINNTNTVETPTPCALSQSLNTQHTIETEYTQIAITPTRPSGPLDTNESIQTEENEQTNNDYGQIENIYTEITMKYTGTDPTLRPTIPKLQISRHSIRTVNLVNEVIHKHLENKETITLEEIHEVLYCAAVTVVTLHTKQPKPKPTVDYTPLKQNRKTGQQNKPQWMRRIENKITALRKEIGQLTQYLKGNLSHKKVQKCKLNNKNRQEIVDQLDTKKQKLQAQAKRLHRYKKSYQRKSDNILFINNQKQFYQKLNSDNIIVTQQPDTEEIQTYWENIWSKPVQHNTHTSWAELEEQNMKSIESMPEITINKDDVAFAIKRTLNWKAPGPDKIQNYWIKYFTSTHTHIANTLNNLIQNPHEMPAFLTKGVTYLKPKDNDTANPAKYRPITCLPTIYKLLTSIITHKINIHITRNKIIPEEQKGSCKGSMGCKEQLIIDAKIHNQVKQEKRNLYYSYIDYQKAFDSVPHSWLLHVLKIYNINKKLIHFLQHAMTKWTTKLSLRTNTKTLITPPIKIARGIFQGDSLSPLWFCLALNPLSRILNNTTYGYTIDRENKIKLTHLLYMDDIKLYASSKQELDHLLKLTENFSTDIKMTFGTSKCKINNIIKGQHSKTDSFELKQQGGTIDSMEPRETYKYLGYQQSTAINHTDIKNTLKNKYKQRLNKILNTQLSARNIVKAVNTFAIPILTYSFGIIKWSDTELNALNTLTRTQSNKHNIHHIHSAVQRFTLRRKLGGRGFIDIKNQHYTQIENLRAYFIHKANNSILHKAIVNMPNSITPLQLKNNQFDPKTKILKEEQKMEGWKSKALHGKYPHQLEQDHIDRSASTTWLTKGNLFSETEGFMIAIQDQVIKTRNYSKFILKEPIETDKCRICHKYTESIDHITGGCSLLARKDYTHRHDNVAKHIHQLLALKYKLTDTQTPYYKYIPKNVLENNMIKLYWDRDIITDRTILSNRPDITLTVKSTKTTYLIDIAIPNTNNLKEKHTEKIQKYIPLAEEIKQMWHQETIKIVPIIISSTGIIPKTIHTAFKILGLHPKTYIPLQKSVILNTCSIVRRFLNPTTLILQNVTLDDTTIRTSTLTHITRTQSSHNTQGAPASIT